MIRAILLAGVSSLAVLGAADAAFASAYIDTTPGTATYTATTAGIYALDIWGAQGGSGYNGGTVNAGGLGYGLEVTTNLTAGQSLYLYVGQMGKSGSTSYSSGGGGGASAVVFTKGHGFPGFIAGGGGGGSTKGAGGQGYSTPFPGYAGNGKGPGAGKGGYYGYPGQFGSGSPGGGYYSAGCCRAGQGFIDGGAGGIGYNAGAGGSGWAGGGGASGGDNQGGGGGGGYSGGGGGGQGYGGGGGSSSFNYKLALSAKGLAYQSGDGEIEISEVSSAAPEPSTWALMLSGFGFIGYVLRRRVARAA